MKVLYDYQIFSLQKYGGISKYFCELIKNSSPHYQYKLALLFSDNNYLQEDRDFFKKWKIPVGRRKFKGKQFIKDQVHFLNQWYARRSVSANNFDLLHPTFYDPYFLDGLKKPYIITVHDLIEFKFNYAFYKNQSIRPQMEKVITNARRIIAISNNTKKDIIETFNIHPDKIDVIYHGYNKAVFTDSINPFGRYILFVGLRVAYKNFPIFARATSTLLNKEKDIRLICVGEPFTEEETTLLRELKIIDRAMAMNVNENTLNQLYTHALVFVYPSLYEGFGMPILEAFANNCPLCLSDASCFPEIAQQAGVYFDPYDEASILAAMKTVVYDNGVRNQIVNAGKDRLMDFSWKKTANETMSSYKRTI